MREKHVSSVKTPGAMLQSDRRNVHIDGCEARAFVAAAAHFDEMVDGKKHKARGA
jgi:hypothetical protein